MELLLRIYSNLKLRNEMGTYLDFVRFCLERGCAPLLAPTATAVCVEFNFRPTDFRRERATVLLLLLWKSKGAKHAIILSIQSE
jgi:hypothetical protein